MGSGAVSIDRGDNMSGTADVRVDSNHHYDHRSDETDNHDY